MEVMAGVLRPRVFLALAVFWMACITIVSSLSDPFVLLAFLGRDPSSPAAQPGFISAAAHMAMFGILALLLRWGMTGRSAFTAVLWSFALAVLFGCVDELHQRFVPGRTATPADVGLDALGAGAALALSSAAQGFIAVLRARPRLKGRG